MRVGGLSYSLYPQTTKSVTVTGRPNSLVVAEDIIDRPVRFLLRGCCISPEEIYTTPSLLQLEKVFQEGIPLGQGGSFYLLPVIEILGDTTSVRSAQIVNYVRVAGQALKTPGTLASENGGRI